MTSNDSQNLLKNWLLSFTCGCFSTDAYSNNSSTDSYVWNCKISSYTTAKRLNTQRHFTSRPPYLPHAEGPLPKYGRKEGKLGESPVSPRYFPIESRSYNWYFERIQVRSRSNPSSVKRTFSLLTRRLRNSKLNRILMTAWLLKRKWNSKDSPKSDMYLTYIIIKHTEAKQLKEKMLKWETEILIAWRNW